MAADTPRLAGLASLLKWAHRICAAGAVLAAIPTLIWWWSNLHYINTLGVLSLQMGAAAAYTAALNEEVPAWVRRANLTRLAVYVGPGTVATIIWSWSPRLLAMFTLVGFAEVAVAGSSSGNAAED